MAKQIFFARKINILHKNKQNQFERHVHLEYWSPKHFPFKP